MRAALALTVFCLLILVSSVFAAAGMVVVLLWLLERGGWF